jgi:hypothetical protein
MEVTRSDDIKEIKEISEEHAGMACAGQRSMTWSHAAKACRSKGSVVGAMCARRPLTFGGKIMFVCVYCVARVDQHATDEMPTWACCRPNDWKKERRRESVWWQGDGKAVCRRLQHW